MQSETIQIRGLPIEKMHALIEKARAAGTTPEEYARRLIEQGLAPRELTFDEILAPFRRQVKDSGLADTELDSLFTEARTEVFRDKKGKDRT